MLDSVSVRAKLLGPECCFPLSVSPHGGRARGALRTLYKNRSPINKGPTLTTQAPPKCPAFSYCCYTKGWVSAYEFGGLNIQTMALLCFSLLGTFVTQTPVGCFREFSLKVVCRKDPGEQTLNTGLWSWRNYKPASDECPVLTVSGVLIKASDIF